MNYVRTLVTSVVLLVTLGAATALATEVEVFRGVLDAGGYRNNQLQSIYETGKHGANDTRGFFVFDLDPDLTAGNTIKEATLFLDPVAYNGLTGTQPITISINAFSLDAANIQALRNGTTPAASFVDLGNGAYTTQVFTNGNLSTVAIDLTSALQDLNTVWNSSTQNLFVIGFSAPSAGNNHKVFSGATTPPSTTRLRLLVTPEPGTLALVGLGLGVVGYRARRRRSAANAPKASSTPAA